ncbi:hypothetical protein FOPG_18283 [Fusarium oxysporum f. sp. conglutinans race 2 54008]|uniref:Uncharacterized protein n=1 Tax=Fusarium oxysporum f. sp. conglutinans race 2 54008 TaxID=1089457 RepID=X0H074_FUSOX|nr:hypothetical protein FOPG_18283 [Fusarium oxysporum f. sp. conglutinans race 2 54008]
MDREKIYFEVTDTERTWSSLITCLPYEASSLSALLASYCTPPPHPGMYARLAPIGNADGKSRGGCEWLLADGGHSS